MIKTNRTTSSNATAAIANNSTNNFSIISKYQLVKEICDVVVNYPPHYRCKVFVTHLADILSIPKSVTAAAPSATPSR